MGSDAGICKWCRCKGKHGFLTDCIRDLKLERKALRDRIRQLEGPATLEEMAQEVKALRERVLAHETRLGRIELLGLCKPVERAEAVGERDDEARL